MTSTDYHSRALEAEAAIKSLKAQVKALQSQAKAKMSTSVSDATTESKSELETATALPVAVGGCIKPDSSFPKWWTPYGDRAPHEMDNPIMVVNSLLPSVKVPFVPKGGGRLIKWYTCGPTVYAPSHMGHARNYVTFDIIRNVLEYYFGYRINLVMNVTDVDDKIILRARQNYLFEQYKDKVQSGVTDAKTVAADIESAFAEVIAAKKSKLADSTKKYDASVAASKKGKSKSKAKAVESEDSSTITTTASEKTAVVAKLKPKEISALKEDIEGQKVKLKVVLKAEGEYKKAAAATDLAEMLGTGQSALSEVLDHAHGSSVTDQSIFRAHSEAFEAEFFDDMRALNVRDPDVVTRVTEYIDNIVAYVQVLVDGGYAYESNGSVYFSIATYSSRGHDFPKLDPFKGLHFSELSMAESEGALSSLYSSEKRDVRDFALWKASKSGEPQWASPWGSGRPGWHIECSAMASHILGDTLDIHSGGVDLKFPHHDNEMAQACAYYSGTGIHKQWVNYWFHAGHLHIAGLKMSKSLKNFVSIKEALEMNSCRQIRLMFLRQAWNAQMDYSDASVNAATRKEHELFEFFLTVNAWHRRYGDSRTLAHTTFAPTNVADLSLNQAIVDRQLTVDAMLRDNFDYCNATRTLFALIGDCNSYLKECGDLRLPNVLLLDKAAAFVNEMLVVFGVIGRGDGHFVGSEQRQMEAAVAYVLDPLSDYRHALATLFRAKNECKADYRKVHDKYEVILKSGSLQPKASVFLEVGFEAQLTEAFEGFHASVKALVTSSDALDTAALCQVCDELRDATLPPLGVEMEDLSGNAVAGFWKLYGGRQNRDYYARYLETEKRQKEVERVAKRRRYLQKEVALWSSKSWPVSEYFKQVHAAKYSAYDESGFPTHDAKGKELSKKFRKKRTKLVSAQKKAHDAFLSKVDTDGADFLHKMELEIEELKPQL